MKRQTLALFAAAAGMAAAVLTAPIAGAEPGADEPLLPGCETVGGSSATGGQTEDCATPGNAQIVATPNDIGAEGAMIDEAGGMWGIGGPGFR